MDDKSRLAEQMPQTIGRYQVQGSIGIGAMGAVYKAFDPLIKRTLAIKTIRLDIPRGSPQYKAFLERFQHEARISGTLSHPHIVTLFDIGEEHGLPFLAMEYVDGETIASLLERGVRFDPERVVGLISQIASAIDYAHSRGVIHRDIKPSNLILSEGDRVKVTDFGIAKLVDSDMTQSGALLGTPSYMSPEQAMGDKLDGRSDLFSLGICAFEMLSGEQPFPGSNVTSILYKIVHVDPVEPPNLESCGMVPQKWHEVFNRVLAKKPDDRYQTGSAFVQDLEYCLGSWFGSAVPEDGQASPTVIMPSMSYAPAAPPQGAKAAAPPPGVTAAIAMPDAPAAPPAPASPAEAASRQEPDGEGPTVLMSAARVAPPAPAPQTAARATSSGRPSPPPPAAARRTVPPPPPPPTAAVHVPGAHPVPAREAPAAHQAPAPPAAVAPPVPTSSGGGLVKYVVLGGLAGLFVLTIAAALVLWKARHVAPPEPATPTMTATPVATEATAPPAEPKTVIQVESVPDGATAFVDEEARGVTPLNVVDLPMGSHEVRVELAGFESKSQRIDLSAAAPQAVVRVELAPLAPATGTADITSEPPGATVVVDGRTVGQTPLSALTLKAGRHRLELRKEGYAPHAATVRVEAGKGAKVAAALQPVVKQTASPAPTAEAVDQSRVYEEGEVDTAPKRTKGPASVDFSPSLKSGERISVSLTWVITETGEVVDAKITQSGGKGLDQAGLAMLKAQRYSPGMKRGVPVKVRLSRTYTFRAG